MLKFVQNSFIKTQFNEKRKKCIDCVDNIHVPRKPLATRASELGTEASNTIDWSIAVIEVGDNKWSYHANEVVKRK